MKSAISFLAITTCFFIAAGCSSQTKQFTEKKLVIKDKETIRISELDLSITNQGCGREWVNEEGRPASEKAFCDLLIKRKDSTYNLGHGVNTIYAGNIEIKIDAMNPWGRTRDSIPPGGCRVLVRRVEGR